MIGWDSPFGTLVFDRDAIVRAALRAYVETYLAWVDPLERLHPVSCAVEWRGDPQRGAFYNGDGCGDYDVVAWTEAGVVGLAFQMGFGPLEQLGLALDAVTGGPDDVRGAVPGLPAELESAFLMAAGMLEGTGPNGEKLAGVGFWFHGDHVAGTLFDDLEACGAVRLVAWGALRDGRLPYLCDRETVAEIAAAHTRRGAAPIETIVDAVTARALIGPTELTVGEIATLLPSPPVPTRLLSTQRGLRKVSVAWPGLPDLPDDRRSRRPSFRAPSTAVRRMHPSHRDVFFDRDTIVRAALYAYVESVLAKLDPLERHRFPVCDQPNWTGDLRRGAFYNGVTSGDHDVVAWTESGVVGLTYQPGFGPIERSSSSASPSARWPADRKTCVRPCRSFPPSWSPRSSWPPACSGWGRMARS